MTTTVQLHSVSIFLKTGTSLRLGFSSGESANKVFKQLEAALVLDKRPEDVKSEEELELGVLVHVSDDFGNTLTIDISTVSELLVTDLVKDLDFNGELGLAKARAEARMRKKAQADSTLSGPNLVHPGPPFAQ